MQYRPEKHSSFCCCFLYKLSKLGERRIIAKTKNVTLRKLQEKAFVAIPEIVFILSERDGVNMDFLSEVMSLLQLRTGVAESIN